MGNVSARELQYPLATKGMFQRFLADSALAANKGTLSARSAAIGIHHAGIRPLPC